MVLHEAPYMATSTKGIEGTGGPGARDGEEGGVGADVDVEQDGVVAGHGSSSSSDGGGRWRRRRRRTTMPQRGSQQPREQQQQPPPSPARRCRGCRRRKHALATASPRRGRRRRPHSLAATAAPASTPLPPPARPRRRPPSPRPPPPPSPARPRCDCRPRAHALTAARPPSPQRPPLPSPRLPPEPRTLLPERSPSLHVNKYFIKRNFYFSLYIFNPKPWDPSNGVKSEGKRWVRVQKDRAKMQTLKSRGKTAVEVQSEGMDTIIPKRIHATEKKDP
uniref:Uncharacterized protein n=1 Tax=Oryza nivara TaxID=4536 RepID=A0A0E0IV30_ORYNI